MKRKLLIILELVAIFFGLIAIFKLVKDNEVSVGLLSLSFGVLAIIWSFFSLNSLSKGTSLKRYVELFFLGLVFLMLFSFWHILVRTIKLEGLFIYPEYIFISLAYITFVVASYNVYKISKDFGFKEKADEIKRILKKK